MRIENSQRICNDCKLFQRKQICLKSRELLENPPKNCLKLLKICRTGSSESSPYREGYLTKLMKKLISKALSTVPKEGEILEGYQKYIEKLSKKEKSNILFI